MEIRRPRRKRKWDTRHSIAMGVDTRGTVLPSMHPRSYLFPFNSLYREVRTIRTFNSYDVRYCYGTVCSTLQRYDRTVWIVHAGQET